MALMTHLWRTPEVHITLRMDARSMFTHPCGLKTELALLLSCFTLFQSLNQAGHTGKHGFWESGPYNNLEDLNKCWVATDPN